MKIKNMSKIFVRIYSISHRNMLDNFKVRNGINTDTSAIVKLIEVEKFYLLKIEDLQIELKTLKIKKYHFDS
jgi:hypothetical protein